MKKNKTIVWFFTLLVLINVVSAYPVRFELESAPGDGDFYVDVYRCTDSDCDALAEHAVDKDGNPVNYRINKIVDGRQYMAGYYYQLCKEPIFHPYWTNDATGEGPYGFTLDFIQTSDCRSNINSMTLSDDDINLGETIDVSALVSSAYSYGPITTVPADIIDFYSTRVTVLLKVDGVEIDRTHVSVVFNEFLPVSLDYTPTTPGTKNVEIVTLFDDECKCSGWTEQSDQKTLTVSENCFDSDSDGHYGITTVCPSGTDCDDGDDDVYPGAAEICDGKDSDCDGNLPADEADDDGDTYMICEGDCDDGDDTVYPGATEICNGVDDDCNGATADGSGEVAPPNSDQDGVCFGSTMSCTGGVWVDDYISIPTYEDPEASCDTLDNDCDGSTDEDFIDLGDACTAGLGVCQSSGTYVCKLDGSGTQCSAIPGAPTGADDDCNNIDEDCSGVADDNYVTTPTTCGDGVCADTGTLSCVLGVETDSCTPGTPGVEVCNGLDDNCDGTTPANEADGDSDTYMICEGDCDDTDAAVNPGATELCNGIDDNCVGGIDEGVQTTYYEDSDTDNYGNPGVTQDACTTPTGYVVDNTDCDDTNAAVNPGATEVCNGIDDDCNGNTDEGFDADSDGVADCFDVCTGHDDNADSDSDGVPDGCDICVGSDDTVDSDGDGVPDGCDICAGHDDAVDTDADTIPDGCDTCPNDAANDADGDGVCGDVDICPGHDDNADADSDGIPDGCDVTIVSSPVTEFRPANDKYATEYSYDVDAVGPNPNSIVYSLITAPTGMIIDTITGLITWTPSAAGAYSVEVMATDGSGSDTQPFTLDVDVPKKDSVPRKKFFIGRIRTNTQAYDDIRPGEQLFVDLSFTNIGRRNTKQATIRITQPDLGISRKLGPFSGPEVNGAMSKGTFLDIPEDAKPGVYTVRISLSDLSGIRRTRHRDFRVVDSD